MSPVFWIFCAFAFAWFMYKCLNRRKTLKLLKNIPSPPSVPIFGHTLSYGGPTAILDHFLQGAREFGGTFRLSAFWNDSIVVSDHRYAEEVLGTTKLLLKSSEYQYLKNWLGTGLLTAEPAKWRHTRKIITPTFHFHILEDFIDVFNACGDILVNKLKKEVGKYSTNIYDFITLCTLDVICETAMGTKVHAQINSDSMYVTSVKEMSRIIRDRVFSLKMINILFYLSSDYKKEKDALKVLHNYTNSVIQKRRKEILEKSGQAEDSEGKKKRLVFLDLLLQSTIDGRPMTDEEVREEVDTFMFEGHDTTATAISATLYCLAYNRDIQVKAVDELKAIFGGGDGPKTSTYVDLENMKYLDMVIKEALRLYPPVPFYARIAEENTNFGGEILPKGVNVAIFAWGLHRNPDIFPDPEIFDPERFSLENQNNRDPFSYVPFSAGSRNCIGQRFAMLEVKSTVAKILWHFDMFPVRDFKPIWVPNMVLKSLNGVEISLRERHL